MSIALDSTKLNLGSGRYPMDGWVNVDAFTDADIQQDIFDLTFEGVERVRMSHLLEHISWRRTQELLERVRSWMAPNGLLTVEVPDMETILIDIGDDMKERSVHPLWFKYVYGDQSHSGEYHLAGFTEQMLRDSLSASGWQVESVSKFLSDMKGRERMPCLEAVARA